MKIILVLCTYLSFGNINEIQIDMVLGSFNTMEKCLETKNNKFVFKSYEGFGNLLCFEIK